MLRIVSLAVMVLVSLCSSLDAAKVKVWHQYSSSHYDKAQFANVVVSNEGALRLSRQLQPLASLEATHVWDIVEDKDGNLIAATGDEGRIYKVAPDGDVSILYTAKASQVLCLTQTSAGIIYAGTGPGGQVIRIEQGKARVFCETHANYVWSLAVDPETQEVYAGTGSKGRIYRISPEGKARLFYQTRQEHILCVAVGPQSTVYAGTDKGGLVYRIDAKGKGFVLHQAAQAEVRSLKLTGDGLCFGTSASRSGAWLRRQPRQSRGLGRGPGRLAPGHGLDPARQGRARQGQRQKQRRGFHQGILDLQECDCSRSLRAVHRRELGLSHCRRRHGARGLSGKDTCAQPAVPWPALPGRHRHGRPAVRGR